MSLSAWRVEFTGQPLIVAEQSLVEYVREAVLFEVPGSENSWSAVTFYQNEWLPVLCWKRPQTNEAYALLILQLLDGQKIAVIISEAPARCRFSNDVFTDKLSDLPELWRDTAISCVQLDGEILPIIAPEKLLELV